MPRSGAQFRQFRQDAQTVEAGVDYDEYEESSENSMSVGPNEKCVNKVMMVEETEYQEEVKRELSKLINFEIFQTAIGLQRVIIKIWSLLADGGNIRRGRGRRATGKPAINMDEFSNGI